MLPRIDPQGGPADVLDSLRAGGMTVAQLMRDTGRSDVNVRRCLWSLGRDGLVQKLGISWYLTARGRNAAWALQHRVPTHRLQWSMAFLAMLLDHGPLPRPASIRSQDRALAKLKKLGLIDSICTTGTHCLRVTEAGAGLVQQWREHEQRQ